MNLPLIIDSFAGGGGASTGIEMALGRSPDVAINHSAAALALHAANHPETLHLDSNIWDVDPLTVTGGHHVGLFWASLDCKHFSKAKGGAPRDRNIRDLAWVVVKWAEEARPDVICMENVEEFVTWGPVDDDGQPIRDLAGVTFDLWVRRLKKAGYKVQWRELRACDYGAPTIRKRWFLVARRDGRPIVWPKPTHGDPASAEVRMRCISAPCSAVARAVATAPAAIPAMAAPMALPVRTAVVRRASNDPPTRPMALSSRSIRRCWPCRDCRVRPSCSYSRSRSSTALPCLTRSARVFANSRCRFSTSPMLLETALRLADTPLNA